MCVVVDCIGFVANFNDIKASYVLFMASVHGVAQCAFVCGHRNPQKHDGAS